jgi:hypothetical protein
VDSLSIETEADVAPEQASNLADLARSQRPAESDLGAQESYDHHILRRARLSHPEDPVEAGFAVPLASPFPFPLSTKEARRSQFGAVLQLAPDRARSDLLVTFYVRWNSSPKLAL